MSRIRSRFLKDVVTVWRQNQTDDITSDPYATSWTLINTFPCNYIEGGKVQRNDQGSEFQPKQTIRLKDVDVKLGDKVIIGTSTAAEPPDEAEVIKAQKGVGTPLIGSRDLTVYTG